MDVGGLFADLRCAARCPDSRSMEALIDAASARFGVPVPWIERIMHAENRGRTHQAGRPIRSSAGAMGLMQLMPGIWTELPARLHLGHHPDDPRDNILAGIFYRCLVYDRFRYPACSLLIMLARVAMPSTLPDAEPCLRNGCTSCQCRTNDAQSRTGFAPDGAVRRKKGGASSRLERSIQQACLAAFHHIVRGN